MVGKVGVFFGFPMCFAASVCLWGGGARCKAVKTAGYDRPGTAASSSHNIASLWDPKGRA